MIAKLRELAERATKLMALVEAYRYANAHFESYRTGDRQRARTFARRELVAFAGAWPEGACSPANILRLIAVAEAAERVADRWRHHGANATDTAALSAAIDALRKGDGA